MLAAAGQSLMPRPRTLRWPPIWTQSGRRTRWNATKGWSFTGRAAPQPVAGHYE